MSARFRRRALCAALGLGSFCAGTSTLPAQASAPMQARAAARWDSLVAGERYFELRDELNIRRGDTSAVVRYFRGVLAAATNRPDDAIEHLRPLVPSARRQLGATRTR